MSEEKVATLASEPSAEEWRCVRAFLRRASELSENSLIRDGFNVSGGFSWKAGEQPSYSVAAIPDEEPFRALLLTFRHFWANDEPSNFLKVTNILSRHAPEARPFLDPLRSRWKDALFGGAMEMSFNGEALNAHRALDLWLNAHYFHNDQQKEETLNRLFGMMSPDFVKLLLANAVTECCKAILSLNHAIKGLGEGATAS